MTRILVTGHKGMIGSQLIKKLSNYEIITDSINKKRIDLRKNDEVMKIEPVDIVIHLGGKTEKGLEWKEYFENNIVGTQILGSSVQDCSNLSDYDSTSGATQTGWALACEQQKSQTQNAYALLMIVLIVIAAVVILTVVKLL